MVFMFPGAEITFEDTRQTGSHLVCSFTVKDAEKKVVIGIDHVELNCSREINMVGFVRDSQTPAGL